MKSLYLLNFFLLTGVIGCSSGGKMADTSDELTIQNNAVNVSLTKKQKHLNINVLLDLSDRIDSKVNQKQPSQKERDIAAIMMLCKAFKDNVNSFNAFKTQAKIKVFFYPEPFDEEIARIAKDLNVSCQAGNSPDIAKSNKTLYQSIDSRFSDGLNKIYDLATKSGKYPGSNIFRFMKDQINTCTEDTSLFRNILVILTDGYVYDQNEKYRNKNRYSYIEKSFDHFKRFRNRELLANEFDQKDYGLIKVNDKLGDVEVLVLELSPPIENPVDVDILKKYWNKWLNEMGVVKWALYATSLPVYTEKYISDFLFPIYK